MREKYKIIFIDTFNITKSIIAESYLRSIGNDIFNIYSTGVLDDIDIKNLTLLKKNIFNYTLEILSELELPIIGLKPLVKVDKYINRNFNYIITMSDEAKNKCPFFIGTNIKINWEFGANETFPIVNNKDTTLNNLRLIRKEVINYINRFITSFTLKNIRKIL